MRLSLACQRYATVHDRPGYPWHVFVADVVTGWLRRWGL